MNATRKLRGRRSWLREMSVLVPLTLLGLLGSGCAAQVYQRERLVDRIMSFEAEDKEQLRRMKAFEAREGSTGGVGGAGGGCACN